MPTPRDRQILEAIRTHSRLTGRQIQRLFFRRSPTALASTQAVNARLRRLVALGYLDPVVVNGGHGAGPYAYGLAAGGRSVLQRLSAGAGRGNPGPAWHALEVAELRVCLQEALEANGGELAEWLGEPVIRALIGGRRRSPIPDALVHWRLRGQEGAFLLEWDRGTESLAVLTAKLDRYGEYWRARGHRELVPGLGLRPRLAIVVQSQERATRLAAWLGERAALYIGPTVLVGVAAAVLARPLGAVWRRPDGSQSTFFG